MGAVGTWEVVLKKYAYKALMQGTCILSVTLNVANIFLVVAKNIIVIFIDFLLHFSRKYESRKTRQLMQFQSK